MLSNQEGFGNNVKSATFECLTAPAGFQVKPGFSLNALHIS